MYGPSPIGSPQPSLPAEDQKRFDANHGAHAKATSQHYKAKKMDVISVLAQTAQLVCAAAFGVLVVSALGVATHPLFIATVACGALAWLVHLIAMRTRVVPPAMPEVFKVVEEKIVNRDVFQTVYQDKPETLNELARVRSELNRISTHNNDALIGAQSRASAAESRYATAQTTIARVNSEKEQLGLQLDTKSSEIQDLRKELLEANRLAATPEPKEKLRLTQVLTEETAAEMNNKLEKSNPKKHSRSEPASPNKKAYEIIDAREKPHQLN